MNMNTSKDRWDDLSLREKSDMMKVAVQQGIYNLSDIRKAYNEYAEGGPENQPYTPFLNETPMQAAMRQMQSPGARASYWNATHPQTTNETPIVAQPDGTFRRETRNIPLNTAEEAAKTALEFTPVVGDVLYAGDVADEARQGNYGTAAALAGLALLPNVVEKPLKKGLKKIGLFDNATTAAKATPAEWTAAQDAAIARGDIAEAQRLRDLHFKVSAPNTKTDVPLWTSSEEAFNSFDLSHFGETDSGFFGYGHYLTPIEKYAATYHPVNRKFYANIENPYIGSNDQYFNRVQYVKDRLARRKENVMRNLRDGKLTRFSEKLGINENTSLKDAEHLVDKYIANETVKWNDRYVKYANEFEGKDGVLSWRELQGIPNKQEGIYKEVVVPRGEQIKSANAVTYDNNGIRIPLGERDNFNVNDIRYIWPTALLGGTAAASYANQQGLGGPLVQLANRYEEGGPTEEDRVLDLSDRGYKSKEDLKITGTPPLAFAGKAASAIETLLQGNIRKDIAKKGAEYLKPVIKYAEENLHPVVGKAINYGYTALVKPIIEFGQVPEELGRASLQDTAVNMMAHELKRKKACGGPLVDLANRYY